MNTWQLPRQAVIGGEVYGIHPDFRDILEIFAYWNDPDLPEFLRWALALALFYDRPIPQAHSREAMQWLARFLAGGREPEPMIGQRLLDWEQDATLIAADINRAAGCEVRQLPFVHWWTFLGWFHTIGKGRLSTVVAIRGKLQKGVALEPAEEAFYRAHPTLVALKPRYSRAEREQIHRLEQQLNPGREE